MRKRFITELILTLLFNSLIAIFVSLLILDVQVFKVKRLARNTTFAKNSISNS